MTMGRRTSTYVGVALLGGMVGAVLGLLVAPGPGDETRRRIARRYRITSIADLIAAYWMEWRKQIAL